MKKVTLELPSLKEMVDFSFAEKGSAIPSLENLFRLSCLFQILSKEIYPPYWSAIAEWVNKQIRKISQNQSRLSIN
jgi:L-asparaginase/Glu-tRNA(Gln) amidotransferase subunit D